MPTFEIKAGGKTFEVNAPDIDAAQSAFRQFSGASAPVTSSGSQATSETQSFDTMGNATGATEQIDSSPNMPYGEQMSNVGKALDNGARQFVKGIPVLGGAMDKIAAAGDAATHPVLGRGAEGGNFSDRYAKNLAKEKARDAAFEAANPNVATGLNVVGGVAATLPLAATQLGARALGMVGSTGARVVQGATGGAAIGAADATTRGDDVALGTGVGGTLGAVSPVLGRVAGAAVERIARSSAPEAIAGYSPRSIEKVSRALTDDALDPAALQRLGPDAMLLDAGPNLRMQGEALATQPGGANRIVSDAVSGRHQRAAGRIANSVDETLGPYQNFRATQDAAIATRRANANAAYRQAFEQAQPVDINSALSSIDDVLRPGLSRVASGGPAPDSIEAALTRVRNVLGGGNSQRINARELHTVKMDLDDSIEAAIRGGKYNQARVLSDVRGHLVDGLDTATGGANGLYAQARRQFRSDSAVVNALDDGRSLFNKGTRPDDVVALVREMSDAERQAFRIGARDAVDEVMGSVRNDALAARNLFAKDWNERKLAAVVGREQADRLLSIVGRENTFADTFGAVQRGSQTRGRLAAGSEFPNKVEATVAPHVVGRTAVGTAEQGLRAVANALRSSSRAASLEREGADAARILTAQGPQRDRIVEALTAHALQQRQVAPLSRATADIVTLLSQGQREPLRLST